MWNFAVIGEAAKQVLADVKKMYPEIAWNRMAGMRESNTWILRRRRGHSLGSSKGRFANSKASAKKAAQKSVSKKLGKTDPPIEDLSLFLRVSAAQSMWLRRIFG